MDTPVYLEYLVSRFLDNGGKVIRGTIQHIDQLVEGGEYAIHGEGERPVPPDAIVVYPRPRPEITRDILERAFALCPELVPPEIRAVREPTVEDLLPIIIEEGCGFRPGRKGGIKIGGEKKGSVSIVYNYGHGGYGYIASWGSANRALAVLEGLLKK
ncbi:hypothetical protein C0995_009969 [Termitomyces sp. Mi166|nr:hypothetical protein C0995_009969 [Termitomyces sp. Mi166\